MQTSRLSKKDNAAGPLRDLSENPYISTSLNYPEDIESLAHAMIFNINVSDRSQASLGKFRFPFGWTKGMDTVDTFEGGKSRSQKLLHGAGVHIPGIGNIGTQRKTKRITSTISLYVPETVVFDATQDYQTPSLTEIAGQIVGSAMDAVFGKDSKFVGMMKSPGALIAAQELSGYAINPVIEVLYSAPQLRSFQFDFNFAPKSKKEADNVWNIIREFRRYSAPEFLNVGGGALFIAPAEWDITFVQKTDNGFQQNDNLPSISTCVLETINVNYAPENQFVTFKDGMPVHITMRLAFKEIDIITRDRVEDGF